MIKELAELKVVPVLVLENVDDGMRMCEVLAREGLHAAEITFRTAAAPEIIRRATTAFPELFIGAGTILSCDDLHRAQDSGARFAVAPGFNPTVLNAAIEAEYPFIPGVCTPSEIDAALHILSHVDGDEPPLLKFFPAEAMGGKAFLKAIVAPYKHLGVRFMPTGGITLERALDYLTMPEVVAVAGTWLAKAAPDWEAVAATVRETRLALGA